jgi:site-specific DNA recombinase
MRLPRIGGQRWCWNQELRMDQTDAAVWQEVCQLLEDPERLEHAYRQRLHPHPPPGEQEGLQTQMGKLRRGIARLIDSYAEGLIDKAEFEPRVSRLRERLQHLEEQHQRFHEASALEEELRLILGRLDRFAARVNEGLHQADFQTRRDIIRALVKRVEVDAQQIRIVFRVSPTTLPPSSDGAPHSWQRCGERVGPRRFHDHWAATLPSQPVGKREQVGGHGVVGAHLLVNRPVQLRRQQARDDELLVDVEPAAPLMQHAHDPSLLSVTRTPADG